jgi:hypothetical protein
MANFHRGQNAALQKLLAEIRLDETGNFSPWEGDTIKALQNQICKAPPWNNHLTELDVLRIIFSRLYRFRNKLPEDFVGLISNSPHSNLLADIEADIRGYFESIPRPYFVFFPLPQWISLGIAELKLGEDIFLIDTSVTNGTQNEKIKQGLLSALMASRGSAYGGLSPDMRYLRLTAFGYCYSSMESSPVATALTDLKQFLFFGVTSNLFHTRQHTLFSPPFSLHDRSKNVFARHHDLSEEEEISIELPVETADYLHKLQIDKSQLKFQTKGLTLLGGESRLATTSEEKSEAILDALRPACAFINLPKDDPDIDRVRTAIQWYIDAETTQNQAISFLQRCIGLEALFGANDESRERGVTDRLSDRFAYLIGKTQSERTKLKKDFTEIYSKRSDIVHSRVARLRSVDYEASIKAEFMLSRSCLKEISALLNLKRQESKWPGSK